MTDAEDHPLHTTEILSNSNSSCNSKWVLEGTNSPNGPMRQAPQFTYPKGLEGRVNLPAPAPGIAPGPDCVVSAVGGRSTD
jgi:hypothetical protein